MPAPPPPSTDQGPVLQLAPARIARALSGRTRYRYVQPRVEREGQGWKIVSPNCSRQIDPTGGEIPIAWLVPGEAGLWRLHAHDHARGGWRLEAEGLSLTEALAQVCADPTGRYWP